MSWVENIQKAIDYIEEKLLEPIDAQSVGRAINYAPSSFQDLFSAITGYSVAEYIRFRRLSCAADEMEESDCPVTDAAFKYGYETVEAFSKAFKRHYGVPPSKYSKKAAGYQTFAPIAIDFRITGGSCMTRNLIPNLSRVDWSDTRRQNEYVNSVVSALNAVGANLDYDYVCAVSGSAFRTSFSMPSSCRWNHGNYHAIHAPIIIEHTFAMLGYEMTHHIRADYDTDRRLVMESIDRGYPVITLEGVINCSDACVIAGYDNDGGVLLGYNPFMDVEPEHNEVPDTTGYFRKSNWHDGFFAKGSKGRILVIDGPCEKPSKEKMFEETLKLASRLICDENLAPGQYNGLAAHRAFAEALLTYEWDDPFEPYLNVMCNYKQYLDRQYAVAFLRDNGREDLAGCYEQIADLCRLLGEQIPQDFSASEMFADKDRLRPYCDTLLRICDIEESAALLMV